MTLPQVGGGARGNASRPFLWLAYGAALNEGRGLFKSDEQFGQWVDDSGLSQLGTHEIKRDDRSAAMWAAANQDDFDTAARIVTDARSVTPDVTPDRKSKSPLARACCK